MADQNNNTDNNHPTAKDIYQYLWHGRDFELERLWERSVFLGAFLIAVAGAYALYMKDVFIPKLYSTHITATVTSAKGIEKICKEFTAIITEKPGTVEVKTSCVRAFYDGDCSPRYLFFGNAFFGVVDCYGQRFKEMV